MDVGLDVWMDAQTDRPTDNLKIRGHKIVDFEIHHLHIHYSSQYGPRDCEYTLTPPGPYNGPYRLMGTVQVNGDCIGDCTG